MILCIDSSERDDRHERSERLECGGRRDCIEWNERSEVFKIM